MSSLSLDKKIEALLFYKGCEMSVRELSKSFNVPEQDVLSAIDTLRQSLQDRGIVVIFHNNRVSLATAPEMSELIEAITKEELSKELSKAALETLSVIIYRGPVRKSEIDYIRGVSSQFSIRNLLVRGLIEKSESESDGRSYAYQPSMQLLEYLGVTDVTQIPDYESTRAELQAYIDANNNDDTTTEKAE